MYLNINGICTHIIKPVIGPSVEWMSLVQIAYISLRSVVKGKVTQTILLYAGDVTHANIANSSLTKQSTHATLPKDL